MAVVSSTTVSSSTLGNRGVKVFSWTPLTFSGLDSGTPLKMPGSADRSVQVTGTFGAGGSMLIEGSNDGITYATLTDPQGNALVFTAAKIETVMELVLYVRPRVTAGDGTTSLTVTMLARNPNVI